LFGDVLRRKVDDNKRITSAVRHDLLTGYYWLQTKVVEVEPEDEQIVGAENIGGEILLLSLTSHW
jgi:hypothetical protein